MKEKKSDDLVAECGKKIPWEVKSGTEQEADNLLKMPSTSSLCDKIIEGANHPPVETMAEHDPSPSDVTVVEHQQKESHASSVCSIRSSTGCGPSHTLVITEPDGSVREVDKSRPTTRSECSSMHMVPDRRNSADGRDINTVLPVAVQFE